MKYLEEESLERLNAQLSFIDTGDARIFGRLEAYSCKSTCDDKKLKSHIDGKYQDEPGLLAASSLQSPDDNQHSLRKTLFYLVATLNAAFPDYDFSDVRPECFSLLPSLQLVETRVGNTLLQQHPADSPVSLQQSLGDVLWQSVDDVICTKECLIYTFSPDTGFEEPGAENGANLWSFYYLLFNRRLKRIIFFTCRSVSNQAPLQPEEEDIFANFMSDSDMDAEAEFTDKHGSSLSYEQYFMTSLESQLSMDSGINQNLN